jgi:hypothetical protein
VKEIFRFRSRDRYWRVTLRSAPLISAVLLDRWDQKVRIFRWKFLARAVAYRHRLVVRNFVTEAIVEAYRPGGNIVDLGARRQR